MVLGANRVRYEVRKIVLSLGYFYRKTSGKHSCGVFSRLKWKGWVLEPFWKSHFWPILDIFLKMSLKFFPLQSDLILSMNDVTWVLIDVKMNVIMAHYDWIVKCQNSDLEDFFASYLKRDEPNIGSNSLKMLIKRPLVKNNVVPDI